MNFIKTKKAVVLLIKENIVKISINQATELEIEDMMDINAAKLKLVGKKMYLTVFIPSAHGSISKEALEYSTSEEVNKNTIAKAIVATSISNRTIGNFFVVVNQSPAPTKLFKTEEAALKWLNKIEKKYYEKQDDSLYLFI